MDIVQTSDGVFSATIDGQRMHNITAVSRFWSIVQNAIAAGEEVSTLEPLSSVPQEVSRFQAKAALSLAGKLAQADAAVAASNDPILQLAWEEATTFKRNSPGIAALAPAIGLDDAALDALFTTAAGIVA